MTIQIVSVWFAVGALVAIIPAAFGSNIAVQMIVFVSASVLFLVIARPIVKRYFSVTKQATNADMVIGQIGLVVEEIDNIKESGRVKISGLTWTARSENESEIVADTEVVVNRIEGVKLIVEAVK
jgi:membrane protein implicated in regulation of membrane protease activity